MKLPSFERGSFSGHETFPFRYAWLPKAVRFSGEDPGLFRAPDAMVRLGVGKNMVRSIRHWGLATGVLEEVPKSRGRELTPSAFGLGLLGEGGWDPYLEDAGTLWLLHWRLASTPELATTWYWVFSHIPQLEFTKSDLVNWLMQLSEQQSWARASEASLRRDVDCFVRTYAPSRITRKNVEDSLDCPLVELALLRPLGARGRYLLSRGEHASLPDPVFAYAVVDYLQRVHDIAAAKTVPLSSLALGHGSPGRVFCLSDRALLARLERLSDVTGGALVFDETAGLQQLFVIRPTNPAGILRSFYEERGSKGPGHGDA